ncbi:MAG TPA: rhamnulokinase family protein [Flexivirga sp.]|uniref:rhamnulokinase n=1 Tax=Flexivirga sp. TaxID=1962927 RepID=UPI002B8B8851|nr:rhamnulokinase family protein [Flexivirga sp.]HWC24310.1 rhamnulokinase family protein [Flexivirga sp.]
MALAGVRRYAAVDLGASSGRVIVGEVGGGSGIRLREVCRFDNTPIRVDGVLQWDIESIWAGIVAGLRSYDCDLSGIGIDSWAVDYALLDERGKLLGNPVHYRDERTNGVPEQVDALVPPERLFAVTGIQRMPINTIYQLYAERHSTALRSARHALLIPDLIVHLLTGALGSELTNASTTALLALRRRDWATELFTDLGIRDDLFPPIVQPGSNAGPVTADATGQVGVPVVRVGSHDTASAVVGVPAQTADFAFISSGTWSLVGVELPRPVLTEDARKANFSNELGVDGSVRFLRNVMGLWLLQESLRHWEADGDPQDLPALLDQAASLSTRAVVDVDTDDFLHPGDMPSRIREECRRSGQPVPERPVQLVRCILDSLADAYRRTVREAAALSGKRIEVIHLVGGGAQNALLCQLTADRCELPVIAGPVEAAALGNVLVQARADGAIAGGLSEMRQRMTSVVLRRYEPRT